MSYESNGDRYVSLLEKFLAESIAPAEFVSDFCALWRADRDEEYNQKRHWERPYDEELIRQRTSGVLTGDQFSEKWQQLWGVTPDGQALRHVINRMFTTCDVYNESNQRAAYELDENQFRNELQALLVELKAANKAVNPSGGSGGF